MRDALPRKGPENFSHYFTAVQAATTGGAVSVGGIGGMVVQIILTATPTIVILAQGSMDGSTWVSLPLVNMNSQAQIAAATGMTAGGLFSVQLNGCRNFRLRASTLTGGGATTYVDAWLGQAILGSLQATTFTVDSELPAAAALSDTTANPTAPMVGAALMGFLGATTGWGRLPGSITTGLTVNTELPAAAALSDTVANPTTPAVGACALVYAGATTGWARLPGTTAGAIVQGATANASAGNPRPLVIGGRDSGGTLRTATVDAGNRLQVYQADNSTTTVQMGATTTTSQLLAASSNVKLFGIVAVNNMASTAGNGKLFLGTATTATVIWGYNLASGRGVEADIFYGDRGLNASAGLFVQRIGGQVNVTAIRLTEAH